MKYAFTIFLFLYLICSGQNFAFSTHNMDSGLPQNSIKDIIKDKYGFIWISTESNIVKYDGQKFETFENPDLPTTQLGDFYGNIQKDSIVVFGDWQEKQIILHKRRLNVSSNSDFKRTFINSKGDAYVLFNKNSAGGTYFNDQNYYINLDHAQYFFSKGNKVKYVRNGDTKMFSVQYENMKNIFAFDDILFIRDVHQKKLVALQYGRRIVITNPKIVFDARTRLYWQQTTGQVFLINGDRLYLGSFKNNILKFELLYTHKEVKNPYYSIFYDKSYNTVYLGSLTKGLNILSSHGFRNVLDNYVAYSSLPFSRDTFITPEGTELGRKGIIKEHHFQNRQSDRFLMMYDDDKNIFYARSSSIVKLYKNSNYKKAENISFGKNRIKKIYNTSGMYSVAFTDTYNRNFLYFYNNAGFVHPLYTFRFRNEVTSLSPIDESNFIVGSTDGLYIISLHDSSIKKIFSDINIKLIIKTKNGSYWITTKSQGFYLMKSSRLIAIPTDDNKALLSAHYILEDENENLWISSNNGLFKTSKKELVSFLKDSTKIPNYYRYDTKNGLLNNEFNGSLVYSAYQLKNKNLVFPSIAGFVVFNPNEIESYYPKKGNLVIERMKIDDKTIQFFNNSIRVNSTFKHLEIFLDIPYYSNEENLILSVKQGDGVWKTIKGNRKLDVFSLKSGKYIFTFRIYLGPEAGYEYKSVYLEVVPLFYQTATFYFIITVLITIAIIFTIYYRTKHLSGKNRILKKELEFESEYQKKVIETIFHDISTPLKFISILSQKLQESDNPEIQKQYYNSIHKSSEELYKFTSKLKEYTGLFKNSEVNGVYNVYDLIEEKINLFSEIAKHKKVIILNNVTLSLSITTNKNVLSAILHNLIDNAVKNSDKNIIKIKDTHYRDTITITVEDFGVGMNKEQIEYYNDLFQKAKNDGLTFRKIGLGLQLVAQLVKKLNAVISIQNNLPNGTIVQITLKTNSHDANINN